MRVPHLKVAPAIAAAIVLIGAGVWLLLTVLKAPPQERRLSALALSSSGRWLAGGTSSGRIYVWERGRAQLVQVIREKHGSLNDLRFSPDERHLAIANDNLTLVPIGHPGRVEILRDDQANYGMAQFTADGRAVLVISSRGSIEVIEIATRQTIFKACCSTIYGEVAFSPDGSAIFNAGHNPRIWDTRSGNLIAGLTADRVAYAFGPIAFDMHRNLVYMGSQDGQVYAWDLATRQLRITSPASSGYVDTISIVGNTGWVAYATSGGAVQLWNPETGEHRELPVVRTTSNLLFDSSSKVMLMGTDRGVVESWDLVQGTRGRTFASQ